MNSTLHLLFIASMVLLLFAVVSGTPEGSCKQRLHLCLASSNGSFDECCHGLKCFAPDVIKSQDDDHIFAGWCIRNSSRFEWD
ncbi:hypothetical protein BOX15_Mlig029543g1 [Macrostomum lignano]|uniref:DB domain-containing protein n=1 Tax=Macrostomum lignano TaxID=282301 RepID=A0A267EFP3_9PLAT|nr:hypothetical protein BOX15_Mlig029543g1 [Macrostomum lignano]